MRLNDRTAVSAAVPRGRPVKALIGSPRLCSPKVPTCEQRSPAVTTASDVRPEMGAWSTAKLLIKGSKNVGLGSIAAVMDEEVNENGFSFFFNYEHYPPIGGPVGEQFEVFVTRYYDRTQGDGSVRLHDNVIDGPFKARGKTLREAWEKSADFAREWAKGQPAKRS